MVVKQRDQVCLHKLIRPGTHLLMGLGIKTRHAEAFALSRPKVSLT
jgi:hypothetical protein